LNEISEAPFSGMYKMENLFVICASPERFLKKEHSILKTQPIKGTASRKSNTREDEDKRLELLNSEKEKNENVMIVDVARNDLSRISEIGKVQVEELFGVYSYRQVHQMVSTIRCELPETISFEEIIKSTFPMASMTGAPKIRAMEIIDRFENFRRQFYSGSMGYVDPVGNFDSNVIIRSVYYDTSSGELTFSVGSAITAMCEAEKEYEECLLKAKAIVEVIQSL
jgi:para-aminobenzoate synthetase component 1